jgi:hypothetical protein
MQCEHVFRFLTESMTDCSLKRARGLPTRYPSSLTKMAPGQKFKIYGLAKAPRRVFNRVRDAISANSRPSSLHSQALTGTSATNVPNDDPGVVRDRSHHSTFSIPHPSSQRSSALLGTDPADQVGEMPGVIRNRSQDAILPTSRSSSQQSSPHPEPNTSDKLKNAWGVTWSALETALRLLAKSADAFPPLKSAVSGLVACLDLAQVGYGYGYEFNALYLV